MVINTTLSHSGWSYSNGDDQYENNSIGSTISAKILEKLAANKTKNDQQSYVNVIGMLLQEKTHTKQ